MIAPFGQRFSILPDGFSLKGCGSYYIQALAWNHLRGGWGTGSLAHPTQCSPSFLTYCKSSGVSSGGGGKGREWVLEVMLMAGF